MAEYAHGFRIDDDACDACLACMRVCPTYAIRVKDHTALVRSELCIDCGYCLAACTRDAIVATTRPLDDIGRNFAFKVAVPSPVLYGQFPADVYPEHVVRGLLAAGFDAVWDYGVDLILGNRAIVEYVEHWDGPRPLINMTCPVIVRLIQVSYPRMVEQLVQMQPPREIAGREIKRRYSEELGLPPEQIGAIYVTPCQARTISIVQPADCGRSYLDGAIGIPQVYNAVIAETKSGAKIDEPRAWWHPARSAATLRWATPRSLERALGDYHYMSVTGLTKVTAVFDDIEKGKLKDIDVLECYSCWGGCSNGNLTVDNVYVSQAKLQTLMSLQPEVDAETAAEVERRSPEDFSLERPFEPRAAAHAGDLRERVRRVKEAEAVAAALPGVDCGLCGAPTCAAHARDVAAGEAPVTDCVFLSDARLEELRRVHRRDVPERG